MFCNRIFRSQKTENIANVLLLNVIALFRFDLPESRSKASTRLLSSSMRPEGSYAFFNRASFHENEGKGLFAVFLSLQLSRWFDVVQKRKIAVISKIAGTKRMHCASHGFQDQTGRVVGDVVNSVSTICAN